MDPMTREDKLEACKNAIRRALGPPPPGEEEDSWYANLPHHAAQLAQVWHLREEECLETRGKLEEAVKNLEEAVKNLQAKVRLTTEDCLDFKADLDKAKATLAVERMTTAEAKADADKARAALAQWMTTVFETVRTEGAKIWDEHKDALEKALREELEAEHTTKYNALFHDAKALEALLEASRNQVKTLERALQASNQSAISASTQELRYQLVEARKSIEVLRQAKDPEVLQAKVNDLAKQVADLEAQDLAQDLRTARAAIEDATLQLGERGREIADLRNKLQEVTRQSNQYKMLASGPRTAVYTGRPSIGNLVKRKKGPKQWERGLILTLRNSGLCGALYATARVAWQTGKVTKVNVDRLELIYP